MCLAVPGKVAMIDEGADALLRTARVDFGGVTREVSLAFLPEARVGDYVLVHAGVGISRIDEARAAQVLADLGSALDEEGKGET
ncbi:MAG: HypC/HybG/HupF family hydrogenase formation chaperone [Chrysiogenetes bacterium]|nr:HypC/HybG/HupF family hydrogenase formation chaperone [Chrysiogenetes bacterium]